MNTLRKLLARFGLAAIAIVFICPALGAAEPIDPASVLLGQTALTFGLDRIPQFQSTFMQIPLWQYIAAAIYAGLALLAARILDYLVTVQLRQVVNKTKSDLGQMLIGLLHGPLTILTFVLLLNFGLNLFLWPDWLKIWIKTGFKVLLAFSLTYMALKVVDLLANYWRGRLAQKIDKSFNEQLIPLVSKSIKAFLLIMAALVTLDNLNFNVRTLLAGVSISGLALGLAAQDTVGNLFGAAAVFIDKPFKIGDHIKLENIEGIVEEMGLRSTRIRHPDGHLITVPNKTMGNATITNITRRPRIKTVLNFGVAYETTAENIRQAVGILNEVYGKHPQTSELTIGFNQFTDSALVINVVHWWKDTNNKEYVAGMQELNLEIKQRFDDAKISFAFPSRTVYLRQDSDWRIQPCALS